MTHGCTEIYGCKSCEEASVDLDMWDAVAVSFGLFAPMWTFARNDERQRLGQVSFSVSNGLCLCPVHVAMAQQWDKERTWNNESWSCAPSPHTSGGNQGNDRRAPAASRRLQVAFRSHRNNEVGRLGFALIDALGIIAARRGLCRVQYLHAVVLQAALAEARKSPAERGDGWVRNGVSSRSSSCAAAVVSRKRCNGMLQLMFFTIVYRPRRI